MGSGDYGAGIFDCRRTELLAGVVLHEAQVSVRVGATRDGIIRAITVQSLWNAGAFGEHSPTTVGLSGHKSISLYNSNLEAFRFSYDVVYTNTIAAGAYRGYGATQGIFAVESAVNELAAKLGIDPAKLRERNMVQQGQIVPSYFNEYASSCALDRCLARAKQMIGWEEKYPWREMGNGKVRGVGLSLDMTLRCPVTVKAKVTEDLKKNIAEKIQSNIEKIDLELQQLELDAKRILTDAEAQGPQAVAGVRHQIEVERHKRMDARQQLLAKAQETENLEIGAEIIQGTMERVVEVKVGDRMQEIVNTEILVEDGNIIAFRS